MNLEDMSEQTVRIDGQKEHREKKNLAAAILRQTITDMGQISKGVLPKTSKDLDLLMDSLRFIESSLCVRCCEVVNIDYKLFYEGCLYVFANLGDQPRGAKLKTFIKDVELNA